MAAGDTEKPKDEPASADTDKKATPASTDETKSDESAPTKKSEPLQAFELARNFLLGAAVVGVLLAVVFALQAQTALEKLSIGAFGVGMFAAAMGAGGLLGFVFGIPTSLQDRRSPVPPTNGTTADDIPALYVGNTSLEQISDWLTKILVGVGLTQLASIPSGLAQMGDFLAGGLGDLPGANVFATVIVVFALIDGFFLGYLWTRLNLPYLLAESDFKQRLASAEEAARVAGERKGFDVAVGPPASPPVAAAPASGLPADEPSGVGKGADDVAKDRPDAHAKPAVEVEAAETPATPQVPIGRAAPEAVPDLIGLWVDDQPENNASVAQVMGNRLGIAFEIARSTDEAIQKLTTNVGRYAFVITDMGRPGDRRAGFTLISWMRETRLSLPTIIYAESATPDQQVEAARLGAEALTNSPAELLDLVGRLVSRIRMVPRG